MSGIEVRLRLSGFGKPGVESESAKGLMPDQIPNPAPIPPATPSANADPTLPAPQPGPTINIADEFGTAKRNLPPVKVLLLATAGVLIIAGIAAFFQRATPQGAGSLDNVTAVAIPGQNAALVALTFTLHNSGKKSLWVHGIQGKLVTSTGELSGDAVSAVDFDRYYQAFPALKENTQPALAPEDKLQPGQEIKRTVIVSFPVALLDFKDRRSVSVVIQPYDQPVPIVLTQVIESNEINSESSQAAHSSTCIPLLDRFTLRRRPPPRTNTWYTSALTPKKAARARASTPIASTRVPLKSRPWAWPRKPSIRRFSPYIPTTAFSMRSTRSRTTRAKRAEPSAPLPSIVRPAN